MCKVKESVDWPVARDKDIKNAYYDWLLKHVDPDDFHWCLFRRLHQIEFIWLESVPLDANRESDGKALRTLFAEESEWNEQEVLDILAGPCSVLEMLIALSYRIETDLMYDPRYGDRTGEWFRTILNNAKLYISDDDYYQLYIDGIIDDIMARRYRKNSAGSFFPVKDTKGRDWRKTDLWMQMQLYFTEGM